MMEDWEAVEVLLTASAFDERKASTVQAQVWAEELTALGIGVEVAQEAVRRFYRENPDGRVRPGHLTKYVGQLRQEHLVASRAQAIRERERYMLERGGGTHDFTGPTGGLCEVCGLTDEEGGKHPRRRSGTTEELLAALRRDLPPGDNAFREQLAGRMREPRPLPGT